MKKQSELIAELDKVQKFYIAGHRKRDPKVLARDLGTKPSNVKAYVTFLNRMDEKKAVAKAAAEEKAKEAERDAHNKAHPSTTHIRADSLMKKNRGTVIMTPEASQLGDEHRRSHMGPRLAKNVQKIRPD
jgi:hypothetical protein